MPKSIVKKQKRRNLGRKLRVIDSSMILLKQQKCFTLIVDQRKKQERRDLLVSQ